MDKPPSRRRSHCVVCGKRLSEKTAAGDIHWQPSIVDEKGIRCESCRRPKKAAKKAAGKKAVRKKAARKRTSRT